MEKSPECYNKLSVKIRVLNSKERGIVLNVYKYFRNSGACSVAQAAKQTADATGFSYKLVLAIKKEFLTAGKLSTPVKKTSPGNQKTRLQLYDSLTQSGIRRQVHCFYRQNKLPTLKKLKSVLDADPDLPNISLSTLRRLLIDMGFEFVKRKRDSLLIDRDDIIAWRHSYLRSIKRHRAANRSIVYTDETWINAGSTTSKSWIDKTITSALDARRKLLTTGNKLPSGKGGRIILVHAGTENGFIPGAQLVYHGKKDGDYHDEMDGPMYEKYFKEKLLPNIPPNSVIVLDNATIHSRKTERLPTKNNTKLAIQSWLTSKGVQWDTSMLKTELLKLVESVRPLYEPKFIIDEMAKEYGHEVLRLPPYHCELNPIEETWSQIKRKVALENNTFNLNRVQELVEASVNDVTPEQWRNYVSHIKSIEQHMWDTDCLLDVIHDSVIINLEDSSDDDSDNDDVDSDSDLGVAALPD